VGRKSRRKWTETKKSSCRFAGAGSEESSMLVRASGDNVDTVLKWKTVEGGGVRIEAWICEFFVRRSELVCIILSFTSDSQILQSSHSPASSLCCSVAKEK